MSNNEKGWSNDTWWLQSYLSLKDSPLRQLSSNKQLERSVPNAIQVSGRISKGFIRDLCLSLSNFWVTNGSPVIDSYDCFMYNIQASGLNFWYKKN